MAVGMNEGVLRTDVVSKPAVMVHSIPRLREGYFSIGIIPCPPYNHFRPLAQIIHYVFPRIQ